jgi:hypothetical protein
MIVVTPDTTTQRLTITLYTRLNSLTRGLGIFRVTGEMPTSDMI